MEVSDKGKYYLKLVLVTAIAYFSFKYLLRFFPFFISIFTYVFNKTDG